jgi:hypothetical protein
MEAGQNCIMRSFIVCTLLQNVLSDEIKEDEICRARSMHVEMRNAYKILVGRLEQTDHS